MAPLLESALGLTLVQLIFYIPSELVVIFASLFLFDIRKKARFVAVAFALFLANTLAAGHIPSWIGALLGVAILVVPQFVYARDSLARKAFTAVVVQIAVVIAEVPPSLYWIGVADVSPTSALAMMEYLEYLIFARVIHVGSLALLLFGAQRAQRRITGYRTDRGALLFIWFLVLQYLMIALGVYTIELNQAFSKTAASGLTVICVLCILADVVCFVLLDYYNRRERNLWRMVFFQGELDGYLKAYEEIEQEVSLIARVRHDLRNHMSVVMYLAENGDMDAARTHVREMVEGLDLVSSKAKSCKEEPAAFSDLSSGKPFEGALAVSNPASPSASAQGEGVNLDKESAAYSAARRFVVAVFPISQIATAGFLFGYAAAASLPGWFYVAGVVVVMLCFVADTVLFHYISLAVKRGDLEAKARLLEEQAQLQKRYYERLSSELEEALRSRQELKRALLDLEERLSRGDASELKGVFESVVLAPLFAEARYCQNRVVNALVSIKAASIIEEGIDFDCSLSVPEDTPVSTIDLCALFSNMLDNALQACRQAEGDHRFIRLRASQTAGVFAATMENSCRRTAEGDDGRTQVREESRRSDAWDLVRIAGAKGSRGAGRVERERVVESIVREHGWGLRILNDMAERYKGTFDASYEGEGRFRTAVMLVLDSAQR